MAAPSTIFNVTDKSTPGYYSPSKTGFLLLDFHTMFVEKACGPKGLAALKTAAGMRLWAKSHGIQVIHCLIDFNEEPYPTCKDPDRLAEIGVAMKKGGGVEHMELLKDEGDDITFVRRPGYVSALKSPGLDDLLQEKGIKSLILAGLSTSGCVLRTAITATDAEYVVSVISDGCADRLEDVHDLVMGKLLNNRGFVTTAAEFQEGFEKAHGGN
jgi:nicotinamidase-related amidase